MIVVLLLVVLGAWGIGEALLGIIYILMGLIALCRRDDQ